MAVSKKLIVFQMPCSTDRSRTGFGCVVVPPFDCVWLRDSKLKGECGWIIFEVAGSTDATIILKAYPGSRRMHLETDKDNCYVLIFGSHRNRLFKIARNGINRAAVKEDWATISPNSFRRFWMFYDHGVIYVGTGVPSSHYKYKWEDPEPLNGIQSIGLSAWDKHCTFRDVRVEANISWTSFAQRVPSLLEMSASCLIQHLDVFKACQMMAITDNLDIPSPKEIRKQAAWLLAGEFQSLVRDYVDFFCSLSSEAISLMLQSPNLVNINLV